MKKIITIIIFGILTNVYSQKNLEKLPKNEDDNIIKKIELESFSNRVGLEIGMAIVDLAKERQQRVAVKIERLNYTIFLYVDDNLPADKLNWLRRKANVVRNFEESSLSVKHQLKKGKMTLNGTFALDSKEYLARGGSIPIFVKNTGMVAIVSVSGLHDKQDHAIIIDGLKKRFVK
ncbi:heme-binding protein [Tenacibaculum piscium]|uniref:heme-binding protein n=1 Tax=Tenacibaculum piscium TaxID=1458515 RepID=UPI001F29F541|nr:heme-binding protein [Tenacibaculum piscium]